MRNIAERVAVFEAGKLVELNTTRRSSPIPITPNTRRLIAAVPVVTKEEAELRERLARNAHENP